MPAWLKHMPIRLAVLAVIATMVLVARHYVLNLHPQRSDVQRITLLGAPEPRRPEPAPEIKPPPEQPQPDVPQPAEFSKFEDYAPGVSQDTGNGPHGPTDNNLGLDTKGGPGSDAFGLVGKPGGQDITTLGNATIGGAGTGGNNGRGAGGPMAKFAGYAETVKQSMTAELNRHSNLRLANYDATIMVWIDPTGRIKRVSFAQSTGMANIDEAIRSALSAAPALSAPPSDMPQPLDLRIESNGATTAATP